MFQSASLWLCIVVSSVAGILPDLAIRLVENMQQMELFYRLTEEQLRTESYRNRVIKEKRKIKFLKYITIPSFVQLQNKYKTNSSGQPRKMSLMRDLNYMSLISKGKASMSSLLSKTNLLNKSFITVDLHSNKAVEDELPHDLPMHNISPLSLDEIEMISMANTRQTPTTPLSPTSDGAVPNTNNAFFPGVNAKTPSPAAPGAAILTGMRIIYEWHHTVATI